MPMQKSQLHRLNRIAALLKENRYPNSESLIREFRRISEEEDLNIACVKKTVLRDIKALKNEFHCPIAFDRKRNGYYLKHHGWDFISPALLDEHEMLAAVIGARIAEGIFPSPLKNKIRNAVDYLLRNNNPDFLDTTCMDSLTILSGLNTDLDPDVFMTVFQGWQTHRCVNILYADTRNTLSERVIEPHTLVFFNNSWYTRAFCRKKGEPRNFALQRIHDAKLLKNDAFEPDAELIRSVNPDDFLGFRKVRNVKLKVSGYARNQLAAAPLHSGQKIHADGTVDIPEVSREVLFPFILSQRGLAVLLSPAELRTELQEELRAMLQSYKNRADA